MGRMWKNLDLRSRKTLNCCSVINLTDQNDGKNADTEIPAQKVSEGNENSTSNWCYIIAKYLATCVMESLVS